MSFDHPAVLVLLVLCIPPLVRSQARITPTASLITAPDDRLAAMLEAALRILLAAAIGATICGLAGLHEGAGVIARTGHGAHIVLLLDRSLSMDEVLAANGRKAKLSKTEAATNLIEAFFARRPNDAFGIVAFSTQPIPVMPLTEHRDAVAAAMAAMREPGLANTDIGAGFEAALSLFAKDDPAAARVILFVSDGAGTIPVATQSDLRIKMMLQRVHLYYLYLRAGDSPPLIEADDGHGDMSQPAALNAFFKSLTIPYRGFEASDPAAVATATTAIGKIETQPITYHEQVPRRGLESRCYAAAACCLALVILARLAERDFPQATRP
jgi:mxaC protein